MKHLKLFFALFAMLALGVGNAWGADVTETITYSDHKGKGTATTGSEYTMNGDKFSIKDSKFYCNTEKTFAQFMANSTITVTPSTGATIKSIVITAQSSSYNGFQSTGTFTPSTGSVKKTDNTHITWTGSATSTFTISHTKQIRWTTIEVTYEETTSSGETPDPTPVTVTLDKNELNLQAGATETLTATVIGSTDPVTWTSDASNIASVDNTGIVTAVAAGNATITAAIGDVKATCTVTVTAASTPDPEEPETPGTGGDATMRAGTNGNACTVNGKGGIKVGTSSKGGDMQITVPAGATMLHVYAAAWNDASGLSLNITPTSNVTTTSIALTADAGIKGNSPFTLSGDEADYLFDIPLQNITAETTLTFTSSAAKRFVVWGATYETASGDEPGTKYNVTVNPITNGTVTADPTSAEAGTTITLTVTPNDGYVLDALTVTGTGSTPITVKNNEFEMPASNVTVSATFKQDESGEVESNSTATIVFASNANQEDGSSSVITGQTEIDKVVAQGIEFVSGFADVSKVYPNSVHGLKLGTGSAIGKITIGLNISKKVSKITFKTHQYKDKEATIKFSAGYKEGSTSEFGDYTLTFDEPTTVSQIVISTEQVSKGRAYVSQIDIELADDETGEGGEDPVVPTPTVNPTTTFVFNTEDGLAKLGIAYPATAAGASKKTDIENNTTVISNGVGLTMTGGTSTATRVWLTPSGVLDLRVYEGATLTFAVADGFEIIKVDFEGSELTNLAVDDIPMTGTIWEGNQKSVTFKNQSSGVKINTIAVTVAYTRDVTPGEYGTICLPYAVNNYTGATLYKVAGKEGNKVIFDEVTTPEAGMPYIFIAEQEKLNFFCGDEPKATTPGNHNSLQGTFTQIDPAEDNILKGNYVLYNNIIKKCGAYCGLYANRAYFVADDLEYMDKAPAAAPGRRRISLDVTSENTTTGLDNITNSENTTIKVIENGQLIIIRNGEKYNIQGQKL